MGENLPIVIQADILFSLSWAVVLIKYISQHYTVVFIWRNSTAVIIFFSKGHKYAQQNKNMHIQGGKKASNFFQWVGQGSC